MLYINSINWFKMAYPSCFSIGGNLHFLDFHQKRFIISTTVKNNTCAIFFCWHAIQLVFLPPRSYWGGREWYTVVSLIYDLSLLLINDELWGSPSQPLPSGHRAFAYVTLCEQIKEKLMMKSVFSSVCVNWFLKVTFAVTNGMKRNIGSHFMPFTF